MTGQRDVMRRYEQYTREVAEQKTERAVTLFLIQVQMLSATMVPIDTSNLINSEFRRVMPTESGWSGEVGYGARYAAAVHDMPGTLKGQPRQDFGMTSNRSEFGPVIPRAFGGGTGVGNYWDPNAEPEFLKKGAEEAVKDWPNIVREAYR